MRTKSGATAVQIVASDHGRRRILAHIGSARDEVELGLLMGRAQALMDDVQPVLDQAMPFLVRQAGLVPAPAGALLGAPCGDGAVMVRPAQVLSTASTLLFEVIGGVFDGLGFNTVADVVFKDLVVARVVEPTSLLDVDRVLVELGREPVSLSTRKRALAKCVGRTYRELIASACYVHAASCGDLSLVLYDVTTLRTQAEKEDGFRRVGYSKDRSVDPQITVGLLVDRAGFPLDIACFEGNKAETHTIVPVIEAFMARHGLEHIVVAADAGMLSAGNLEALDTAGVKFIVGSRAVKAPIDLESHFAWHGDFIDDGQIVDTITPRTGDNLDNDLTVEAEPVWDPDTFPGSWRAVWQYSATRFAHDNMIVNLQEARAQAVITGGRPARTPRFVKTDGEGMRLDEMSLARARRVAGLKGYVTNMPAALMPPGEVIARYHDLWHVEQSFRITKSDLAARPFFARRRDAIEAHLTIVFAALAVTRTIQDRTGWSLRRVLRALRPLRSATIEVNGTITTIPPAIPPDQQTIIDAINTHKPGH